MSRFGINSAEEAKDIILSGLSSRWEGAIKDLINVALAKAMEKGRIPGDATSAIQDGITPGISYDKETWLMIDSAIWELFRQGILIPGLHNYNEGITQYRVSPLGKKFFESELIDVYDSSRFMSSLLNVAPGLDEEIRSYIHESLVTFQVQAYLATAVMVGCASERLVHLLENALLLYLEKENENEKEKLERELRKERSIRKRRDSVMKRLKPRIKTLLPKEDFTRTLDKLNSTFSMIAETRNDAGHPMGIEISVDEAASLIYQFKFHASRVRNVIIALGGEKAWNG